MNNEEIIQQINVQEQELAQIQSMLKDNKKDLKYNIGLTIGENLHPRRNILRIPKKLKEIKQYYISCKPAMPSKSIAGENNFEYCKLLTEQIKKLSFYNNLDTFDIHYAIGNEIYNAQQNLKACFMLPFRLWNIRKANRRSMMVAEKNISPIEGINKCILFIATNGAGLGHLTRCLAVARRIKKIDSDIEIIFLTTSIALNTIWREGFTAYSIPSSMLIKNISAGQWNALLKNMIMQLLQLYSFSAVIFDGAMPYAPITAALTEKKGIPTIWIKRGSEKKEELVEKRRFAEQAFDYIIIPSELAEKEGAIDKKHFVVAPIVYFNKEEIWSRKETRIYLKIPDNKLAVYIQLGAGNINDIHSDISKIIIELRKHSNIMIVLGESMIGNELKIIEDDVIVLKDYPNAKYFRGFDFAISACGYNSFHELIYLGVPAIYLPNMNTKTDDQYARALIAQNHNAGIVITDINGEQLANAIAQMSDPNTNKRMRNNCQTLIQLNGADSAASFIVSKLFVNEESVNNE